MDEDFWVVFKGDRRWFFEDGDVLFEFDGMEVVVYSRFLCRWCLWFEGLFFGWFGGGWFVGCR